MDKNKSFFFSKNVEKKPTKNNREIFYFILFEKALPNKAQVWQIYKIKKFYYHFLFQYNG